jgi:hypothetical protein
MLASDEKKDTKNESVPKERLRALIINDVDRKERLCTQKAERIVIEESREHLRSDDKKALVSNGS